MADNITQADITNLAKTPRRVSNDEGTVEERAVAELIEADRYEASKQIGTRPPFGMTVARIRPGAAP